MTDKEARDRLHNLEVDVTLFPTIDKKQALTLIGSGAIGLIAANNMQQADQIEVSTNLTCGLLGATLAVGAELLDRRSRATGRIIQTEEGASVTGIKKDQGWGEVIANGLAGALVGYTAADISQALFVFGPRIFNSAELSAFQGNLTTVTLDWESVSRLFERLELPAAAAGWRYIIRTKNYLPEWLVNRFS